jgi:hypothetical protein
MRKGPPPTLIRIACQEAADDRWATSASAIGRGVLLYGAHAQAEQRYATLAAAEQRDASVAHTLAAESYLAVDPQSLAARPPTARPPDDAARAVGADHLQQRLRDFCLEERPVRGDGHCQFRSLAFQVHGTDTAHAAVRAAVCAHLAAHPATYAPFVHDESFEAYLVRMGQGAWGDHVTLQAFADLSGRPVHLVTSYEARGFVQVAPQPALASSSNQPSGPPVLLGFWAEVHYNPIVPMQTPRPLK